MRKCSAQKPKTFSLIVVSAIFFTAKVNAQISSVKFKHIGIGEGLPQNTVSSVLQDSLGFIWFGTYHGLARYDGYEMKLFRHSFSDTCSLCNNRVNCLAEDHRGNLLVGTDNGLSVLNPVTEKCSVVPGSTELGITKIKMDSKNRLWVGTTKGLRFFDERKYILKDINTPVIHNINDEVATIEEDEVHDIWVGYTNRTLLRYCADSNKCVQLPECLSFKISSSALKDDGHGNMWIGTIYQGILVCNYRNTKQPLLRIKVPEYKGISDIQRIRDIAFDNGYVWVGARNGLFRLKKDGSDLQIFQVESNNTYSISNNSICALLKDRSGIVWIGTYMGGVNYIQPGSNTFSYFNLLQPGRGLNNEIVYSVAEDNDKNLWFGTGGGGINFFNRKDARWEYLHIREKRNSIDKEYIRNLCVVGHTLWIGTLNGLFMLDMRTKKIREISLQQAIGNNKWSIGAFAFAKDRNSNGVYVGTLFGLFYCSDQGRATFLGNVTEIDGAVDDKDMIVSLCADKAGNVWIGRMNGLLCKPNIKTRGRKFINFNNNHLLVASQAVSSIIEDSYGIIWFATDENGLVYFDPKTNQFDTLPGLSAITARALVEESPGKLWVSGINNIYRISYAKGKLPFKSQDIKIDKFSVRNGLQSNEFLSAALKLKSGELIFGGYDGAVMFNPHAVPVNKYIAPVVITDFRIRNKRASDISALMQSIIYTKDLVLHHDQSYFTIKFSELNFINSGNNQYAYTMDGLDGDTWHYVKNDHTVSYTNLAPGAYVFKVKAANNDGFWNDKYTSLRITVLYPIWLRWYAWVLYVVAALFIFYFFYSHNRKTNRLKNELHLQQVINEKERVFAAQKMDFFTNISHEIKTPLTLIISPLEKMLRKMSDEDKESEQYKYLPLIHRNCKRLMELVTQLLDFRRLETGKVTPVFEWKDMVSFIKNIVADFHPWAAKKEISVYVSATNDEVFADFDADKWAKIMNNLLSNALKFTPDQGTVTVEIIEEQEQGDKQWITVRVEDNGEGIAEQNLKNIFEPFHYYNKMVSNGSGVGLNYVRDLVALHGGSISVKSRRQTSEKNGYTRVDIKIPVQNSNEHIKGVYEIGNRN